MGLPSVASAIDGDPQADICARKLITWMCQTLNQKAFAVAPAHFAAVHALTGHVVAMKQAGVAASAA